MRIRAGICGGVLIAVCWVAPATGQDQSWQNKWYWGTQGGITAFSVGGQRVAASAGAHWFITGRRSAFYLAFDQQFLQTLPQTIGTGQTISFGAGQRFEAAVYAVPSDNKFQLMLGGGFAVNRITDAQFTGLFGSALDQRELEDASTKASLLLSAGWQYRAGLRWALFGTYQYLPGSVDFVIRSAQHVFNLGIRYAVTHSEEVVTTER